METDQIMRMVYLVMLGSVLLAYFLASRRTDLGATLRMAVLWALLFVGVAAGYGLWQDIADANRVTVSGEGQVSVPRARDGHYHLTLDVNGAPVRFIVDTGATELVLSQRDAERAGLDPAGLAYLGQARTANGVVRIARVTLDRVTLDADGLVIEDRNVNAFVNEGELDVSLLGMAYLERFARIEIDSGRLILTR